MSSLRVDTPNEQRTLYLDTDGRVSVVYTAHNVGGPWVAGRADIMPEDGARGEWFRIIGSRHRVFRDQEIQQFKVGVTIPTDTPPGTYGFRLLAINEDNPEGDYTLGERITLHWNPGVVKRVNRTVMSLLIAVALVGALAIAAVIYLVANREIRPEETLRNVNRAASSGRWDDYWDCWTPEGKDELLVRAAQLLQQSEQQQDLAVWLRSYGIRPGDIQGVSRYAMAGDAAVAETARKLKDRFDDTAIVDDPSDPFDQGKDFFVGAAKWLEDAHENDSIAAHSREEFRQKLQFKLDQVVDIDDDLAQNVAIWDGHCATDPEPTANALRIIFHNADGHWLLHDTYPEQLTRRTVWVPLQSRNKPVANMGDITRMETTSQPVKKPGELEYDETVLFVTEPSGGSGQAILPELETRRSPLRKGTAANEYTLGKFVVSIVPPFLLLRSQPNAEPQIFIERGASVNAGYFQDRPITDVDPILNINPFADELRYWAGEKLLTVIPSSGYIHAIYRGHDPTEEFEAAKTAAEKAGEKQSNNTVDKSQTPAADTVDAVPIMNLSSVIEPINPRTQLPLFDPNSNISPTATQQFLIIEVVSDDPLELDVKSNPAMKSLQRDLTREIKLASQPLPQNALTSSQAVAAGGLPPSADDSEQANAEAAIRDILDRKGFDYFIDYKYKPDEGWFDWGWVIQNGRRRLRLTLNRFGYELSPSESADLWGASALAFRQSSDGLRLSIGDDQANLLLDSNLKFDVPQNTWRWSNEAKQQLASLRTGLDQSLGKLGLPADTSSLQLGRRPVVWSGTSTVMPYNKLDFALSSDRSPEDEAFGSVAISPDAQWLAGGDSTGQLRIWRHHRGQWKLAQEAKLGEFLRRSFPQLRFQLRNIAFGADSSQIAVAVTVLMEPKTPESNSAKKEDPPSLGYVMVLHRYSEFLPFYIMPQLAVSGTAPLCVAFSRDQSSQYLAAGLANGQIRVWTKSGDRYESERTIESIDNGHSPVLSLAFGPASQPEWLAAGAANGSVQLGKWNGTTWTSAPRFWSYGSNRVPVQAVSFSPHGAVLAGVTYQGLRLWQLNSLDVESQN